MNHEYLLGQLLVGLFQGVLYRENDEALWHRLVELQARVREHCATIGLDLVLDEAEGYAWLRQQSARAGVQPLPRLVQRRALTYPVSLVLVLLRKRLAEFDAAGEGAVLVVSRDELADQLKLFLPDTANEARLHDRIDAHLNKVVELGFLRRLRAHEGEFEVRRILKAFVDAQWLGEFEQRLAEYVEHGASASTEDA
jgi:hypothetical protein